jgi:hypothetical protein
MLRLLGHGVNRANALHHSGMSGPEIVRLLLGAMSVGLGDGHDWMGCSARRVHMVQESCNAR